MSDILRTIFTPGTFEPHSIHFADNPEVMWLIIVGHALSALAYTLIPLAILYVVRKRKDLVYNWMFLLFGAFIILCGFTHALHVVIFWYPMYWFQAIVDIITFVVSFATFLMFLYIIPTVVKLTSPKQMEDANAKLAEEIQSRKQSEAQIKQEIEDINKFNEEVANKAEELKKMNVLMAERDSKVAELQKEIDSLKSKVSKK